MKNITTYTIFILVVLLGLIPIQLKSEVFVPFLTQFSKTDYNASSQNWGIKQAADGVIYIGNNKGLLRYNGAEWKLYRIPGNKTIRSIYIGSSNKIYIGAYQEFGYFEKDIFGQLIYHSLSDKLENYKMLNDEIWNIIEVNNNIIFQSFTSFFTFNGEQVKGKRYSLTFLFFQIYNGKIYTHSDQLGFCVYNPLKDKFEKIVNTPFKSEMVSMLSISNNQCLIITKKDGIFLFDGKYFKKFHYSHENELTKANINKAILTSDSLLIIGTIQNGVTAITMTGEKVWTLNTTNNLQNNTVLGLSTDMDNNIWLALDKGISIINLSKSIKQISNFSPSIGAIYTVNFKKPNHLFIGTNQGLYRAKLNMDKLSISDMTRDNKIKEQVWDISEYDGQYICGNNENTYIIDEHITKVSSPVNGGMCIAKGKIHGEEILVQGTYTELCIFKKRDKEWIFSHTIKNFINPIQSIGIDFNGTIWAAHMHEGIFEIKLEENLKTISNIKKHIIGNKKTGKLFHIANINNRIVFSGAQQLYTYDDLKQKIIPYDLINQNIGRFKESYRIINHKLNEYWFIRPDEAALIKLRPDTVFIENRLQHSLFNHHIVENYQTIFPINETYSLIPLENSLALYNVKEKSRNHKNKSIQFESIEYWNKEHEQISRFPIHPENKKTSTDYTNNNIRFTTFYPDYNLSNNLLYSYKLDNYDDFWSLPTPNNKKEYNKLKPGDYTLNVKVLSTGGRVLGLTTYSFEIKPPFYWNTYSILIYIILLIVIIYLISNLREKKHIEKNNIILEKEQEIRNRELEKKEQEIIKLKNEHLENEIKQKSKELASSTLTIIKRNEILNDIRNEILNLKEKLGSQYPNKDFSRMIKLLDENMTSDDEWRIFQSNFDRIHENFFRNLHLRYPDLTNNDLKFCAYLRLNLSTKDIADLMNISTKGVEAARRRIRKKIGIPSDVNLNEFMIDFK